MTITSLRERLEGLDRKRRDAKDGLDRCAAGMQFDLEIRNSLPALLAALDCSEAWERYDDACQGKPEPAMDLYKLRLEARAARAKLDAALGGGGVDGV